MISTDSPHAGRQCARVTLDTPDAQASGGYYAKIPVTPGRTYLAEGYVRTRDLSGPGIVYLSVYQFNDQEKMIAFRDFASVREPTDWQRYEYEFTPPPSVTHIRLQAGLYRKNGTAWFDDIRLFDLQEAQFLPLNTADGKPGDGLKVTPQQIGIFDPSYPLKRAVVLRTAAGQQVVRTRVEVSQTLQGWGATGIVGYDTARWVPLLETFDRYGRARGPAGSLLLNYGGYYAGSCWAFFGLENVDLFADADSPPARMLGETIRFLVRGTYLHNLQTASTFCRPGEPVKLSVRVSNRSHQTQDVEVTFRLLGDTDSSVTMKQPIDSGQTERLEAVLPCPPLSSSVCRVQAELSCDGQPIDIIESGAVVPRRDTMAEGPKLRFRDNYFTVNDRPLYLFGTDTYARTYMSAAENPLTWRQELSAAHDMGMNLYENLQYQRPKHQMGEDDWEKFLAMAQLVQEQQLVFMPGMLIGHNTAIGPELLEEQSELCRQYAQRMRHVPGLVYYINGDYQLRMNEHPAAMAALWQQWLRQQYASIDALNDAWKPQAAKESFEAISFPPPFTGLWDDVAAVDAVRFQMDLTRRWNEAHVVAVRSVDTDHPITSEYYSQPSDGIDLRLTIDGQDVSNIGYFDEPRVDIDRLPLKIAFADMRFAGKGVSLGEYGVKTHPAWTVSNGAVQYHIRRTEEQQRQLFMAVAHYGLGMGCSKVQNWCLRDAQTWVFPWGIFYPNQLIPKDVAYTHRNLSMLWRALTPRYEPAPLAVALASHLRLGNDSRVGAQVAYRTCADLLASHLPFNCLDDDAFDQLDRATRVVIYPSPMALSDKVFRQLCQWVEGGGILLVTGDVSYDVNRQRTRGQRLSLLTGGNATAVRYQNIRRDKADDHQVQWDVPGLPPGPVRRCLELKAGDSEVLGRDDCGQAVLVRHALGKGVVYYCTDPLELASDVGAAELRQSLYQLVASSAGLRPTIPDDLPWLQVMCQPTRTGKAWVIYNTGGEEGRADVQLPSAAAQVRLTVRNRWPALVVATDAGDVVVANADGNASGNGERIMNGKGQRGLLSLDGNDLRRARAMLLAPFEPGNVVLPAREGHFAAHFGEFVQGKWITYESVSLEGDRWQLNIDPDRATLLVLICPSDQRCGWEAELTERLMHPDRWAGY